MSHFLQTRGLDTVPVYTQDSAVLSSRVTTADRGEHSVESTSSNFQSFHPCGKTFLFSQEGGGKGNI